MPKTPFMQRTQAVYTANGNKVCTYRDAVYGYTVAVVYPDWPKRCTDTHSYRNRAEAMAQLQRVLAWNEGVKHA